MERWLRARLAEAQGVCANVRFPFPSTVMSEIVAALGGEAPAEPDPWAPERLTWQLLDLLPSPGDEELLELDLGRPHLLCPGRVHEGIVEEHRALHVPEEAQRVLPHVAGADHADG